MCCQNSVLDRALVSDESGGLEAPDTDLAVVEDHIGRLPDGDLKQAVIAAHRLIGRTQTEIGLLVGELDRRDLPAIDERLSTVGWLQHHTSMAPAEASGTLKAGRALPGMPAVTRNALRGDVPWQSVRAWSQARDRDPSEFKAHEEVFADIATYLSVKDLRRAVSHWEQQVNYDQALLDAKHFETQRSLFHSQTLDGLWSMKATFTPEGGHIIEQAINAITDPTNIDPVEMQSPAHRRADAMVDICSFYLTHNTGLLTSGGECPHVTVTVDYETIKGHVERLPEIDRTPSPQTRCDASPVTQASSLWSWDHRENRWMWAGKHGASRLLSDEHLNNEIAVVPGTDAKHPCRGATPTTSSTGPTGTPSAFLGSCSATLGGDTNLDNTRLLCRRHHTATHTKYHNDLPPGAQPVPDDINRSLA